MDGWVDRKNVGMPESRGCGGSSARIAMDGLDGVSFEGDTTIVVVVDIHTCSPEMMIISTKDFDFYYYLVALRGAACGRAEHERVPTCTHLAFRNRCSHTSLTSSWNSDFPLSSEQNFGDGGRPGCARSRCYRMFVRAGPVRILL